MSAVPPCTSWRGHKFQPRYSTKPSGQGVRLNDCPEWLAEQLLDASLIKTYEFDICVRCGATVRKDSGT